MRKTFTVIDRLAEDDREMVTGALHELYEVLELQLQKKMGRAVEHTDLKNVACLNPQYVEDIQTDFKPLLSIARYEKHKVLLPGEDAPVPRQLISGPKKSGAPDKEKAEDVVDALEGKGEEKKGEDEGASEEKEEGKGSKKPSGGTKEGNVAAEKGS